MAELKEDVAEEEGDVPEVRIFFNKKLISAGG